MGRRGTGYGSGGDVGGRESLCGDEGEDGGVWGLSESDPSTVESGPTVTDGHGR